MFEHPTQAFDLAGNSAPFNVTIEVVLVNDNVPILLLNGTGGTVNYNTVFYEGQNYPGFGGTTPVQLSDGLSIRDDDAGPKYLTRVVVQPTGGMRLLWDPTGMHENCVHFLYATFPLQVSLLMIASFSEVQDSALPMRMASESLKHQTLRLFLCITKHHNQFTKLSSVRSTLKTLQMNQEESNV